MEKELFGFITFCVGLFLGLLGAWASYKNGLADGFACAKSPRDPLYCNVRKILRETMGHRFKVE